jgi:hypothetical protein
VLKFLLNLLVQIFKDLVNSKIQFLFRKEFLFSSGPVGPAALPTCSAFRPSGLRPNPSSGQPTEPAHRPWISFPLPSPTRPGAHTAHAMCTAPSLPTVPWSLDNWLFLLLTRPPSSMDRNHSPSQLDSGNRRLQVEASTPAMKAPWPSHASPPPYKRSPCPQ